MTLAEKTMPETFVLLHGSWHGGWAWEPAAWCLREHGHRVYTPTYPGHRPGETRDGIRHDDYVAAVTSFIERMDLRDVVLAGHSFGGSVVSRVSQAIPARLKRLVFHTAFVLEDQESVIDNMPAGQRALFSVEAKSSPDGTVVCPWEVFRDDFMQDAAELDARSVWERLVPQPFEPWAERLDLKEFHRTSLPKSYIAVRDDRALPTGAWHPGMSSRLGAFKVVEVGGSHEMMFTRPAELARALIEASGD
jgi:pimeloyl-ACP methyl ester carboxylesterase